MANDEDLPFQRGPVIETLPDAWPVVSTVPTAVCAFNKALACAQGAITNPAKNRDVTVKMKEGGSYQYSYTTLDEMLDVIRAPMAANGLSIRWAPRVEVGKWMLDSIMAHEAGHSETITIPIIGAPIDMQKMGGALSYARRYSIGMWFTMASDEDDDGSAASGKDATLKDKPRRAASPPAQPPPAKPAAAPKPAPQPAAPARSAPVDDAAVLLNAKKKLWACAKALHIDGKYTNLDGEVVSIIVTGPDIMPMIEAIGCETFTDEGKTFVVARYLPEDQLVKLANSLAAYKAELMDEPGA